MKSVEELFDIMTFPSPRLIKDMSRINGDILIAGAGGKIGPSLCIMAKRACDAAGIKRRVIAVSMFDSKASVDLIKSYGVEVIEADMLDPKVLQNLPDAPNIIFMAGRKFGTSGNQPLTWAINVLLPSQVAQRYGGSRIVAFSTGNVYGMRPIYSGGALEEETLHPVGEYAQSCLGRERVLEYWSNKNNTPILIFRLNYAIDMRYGVLHDIAVRVYNGQTIDLSTGYVNCIWQGDACEYAIRSLIMAKSPIEILNVTGPEAISIEYLAREFGKLFKKEPVFIGQSPATCLFSNASKMVHHFGYPNVALIQMVEWTAEWIMSSGVIINAPTHFEQRDGSY